MSDYRSDPELNRFFNDVVNEVKKQVGKGVGRERAERLIYKLETDDKIDFKSEKIRQQEVDLVAQLDEANANEHVQRAKVRYQRKLTNAEREKQEQLEVYERAMKTVREREKNDRK